MTQVESAIAYYASQQRIVEILYGQVEQAKASANRVLQGLLADHWFPGSTWLVGTDWILFARERRDHPVEGILRDQLWPHGSMAPFEDETLQEMVLVCDDGNWALHGAKSLEELRAIAQRFSLNLEFSGIRHALDAAKKRQAAVAQEVAGLEELLLSVTESTRE
jgi:hypothetical protein